MGKKDPDGADDGDFTTKLQPALPSGPSILAHERSRSAVNTTQLARHLLHRDDFLARQARVLAHLRPHALLHKGNQLNLSRPERFHLGLARAKLLRRLSLQHGWDRRDYEMAAYLVDEMSPYFLQSTMFATTIREQGSDAQKAVWLPRVEAWEVIGCYGQTELGHGSNVRGIECEARWLGKGKGFVLHSPTLTASKWWNGSLGRTANHAIVVAQLMLPVADADGDQGGRVGGGAEGSGRGSRSGGTRYKSHGPRQFIVQIRDMETHKPLPGIVVGDIGPKYGYTSMDNGYMLFDQVEVPHDALLSRYSGVDAETGAYIEPDNPATVYGSLTFVRAQIVEHARLVLARAVTVAVRYTAIRRQFADRDAKSPAAEEEAVLNYPTVQIRVLPLLAATYALHYTGEVMFKLYWATRSQIEKSGDFSRLAEMHAQSSGLKSLCTMLAADGIEVCRRAMGGHGFGGGSGLIPLNNDYLSKPTVEGDNWMITQQTASYLIKRMEQTVRRTTLQPTDQVDVQYWHYMRNRRSHAKFDILGDRDQEIVSAFQHRASYLAHRAYQKRVVEKQSWTAMMIELHRLSQAHSEMLLVLNFHNAISNAEPDPPLDDDTRLVLRIAFQLFALWTVQRSASEFLLADAMDTSQLSQLGLRIQELLSQIRPHAVRLVDAWSIPDYLLQSSLGRYDGDVYNDLFRKAHKENPLNRITFNPNWKSEEIVMGEGELHAKNRIEALALGLNSSGARRDEKAKI